MMQLDLEDVDWLDGVGPFTFDRIVYSRMLDDFGRSSEPNNAA